jgi:hypothetical protein
MTMMMTMERQVASSKKEEERQSVVNEWVKQQSM